MTDLSAPFPWFGGKSRAAHLVWGAFGNVANYIEPFFGSGAVLLARPHEAKTETVNDLDGLLVNFWRACAWAPDEVARHADWPVSEPDLSARHLVLVERRPLLTERLAADAEFFDAKLAGWWVWGACAWIGSGWCSGEGPWVRGEEGLVLGNAGQGINRQLPHLEPTSPSRADLVFASLRPSSRPGEPVLIALPSRLRESSDDEAAVTASDLSESPALAGLGCGVTAPRRG